MTPWSCLKALRLTPSPPHTSSLLSSKAPVLAMCQVSDKGHLKLTTSKADWIPCHRETVSITDLFSILPAVTGPFWGPASESCEES